MVGTTISHYKIIEKIGQGGMGEVYRATDTKLHRDVALKVLPEASAQDEQRMARFSREAQVLASLNHPNIASIYGLEEADGKQALVLELVEGEDLAERIKRGAVPLEESLKIALQIAQALEAAHDNGIIHRDLKPANVKITPEGVVKVLDFGLARVQAAASAGAPTVDDLTKAGAVLGTVSYMSPEQARGEELDARTDLFSLGVVLYEMTTGQPAFTGNTSAIIFERLFNKVLDPPTRLNPKMPKELDALLDGLLAKDRNQRSSSARDLRTTIERIKQAWGSRTAVQLSSDKKSIVVLPFENLSADPDNEYFSDGLTDEIITDLSQIGNLRVISRSSSMQMKGSGKTGKAIAAELNVRYVLEGSVRKAGNAVRVTAQLIDPETDEHLWADKYSGKLEDIFEIQEQISRRIVDALKMELSPDEERKLSERAIDNIEAFECYHRARRDLYTFTGEGLDRAAELIRNALDIARDNELLYASMGAIYWQYVNAAIKPDDGYIERAEGLARKVFTLNPESAAAHSLLGMVRQNQGQPTEAVQNFRKALAIDPNDAYARSELPRVYMCVGAESEGRSAYNESTSADPFGVIHHAGRLGLELLSGHNELVQNEGLRFLASAPEFHILRWEAGMALVHGGQLDEASRVFRAVPQEKVPTIAGQACRFMGLALEGWKEKARSCFDPDLLARARNVEFWSWWVAESYAFINEQERVIVKSCGWSIRRRSHPPGLR